MEPIHLRLNASDSLYSRKLLLSSQINFLNTVQRIDDYKEAKSKELSKKIKLKSSLVQLTQSLNTLMRDLPKTKVPKAEPVKPKEKRAKRKISDELKEIKKQLAILNSE